MKTINNIEEQRVSFANAKLLKEEGFAVKCTHYYILNFSSFKADFILNKFKTPIEDNENIIQLCTTNQSHLALAPTKQVAIDWIKINFGIQIFLDYFFYDGFHYGCKIVSPNGNVDEIWNERKESDINGSDTPEEAIDAAIFYTLKNLI